MGQILSSPTNQNQPWKLAEASRVESSKRVKREESNCDDSSSQRLIPVLPDEISLQILARMPRMCYLNAKMVSRSWKAAVTGSEVYRVRTELGVSEEWLYILTKKNGEKLCWHAFDPLNSRWQRLPPMPTILPDGDSKRSHPGLRIWDLVNNGVKISDIIRGWLGQKDSLDRIPFCGCAIGTVHGSLYVLGGFSRSSAMKHAWRYDPCTNSWHEVSSMCTGRAFCKTSLLNDKLYVVGGVSRGRNGLTPLQSAEVYNPATGIWSEVPNMPFSKAQVLPTAFLAELLKPIATGMTTYRGKLCVPQSLYSWPFFVDVGGEIFDPESNSWTQMPAGMGEGWPARQAGTKLSAVVDGELYALEPPNSSDSGKIKRYDHCEDTWKVVVSRVPVRELADSESPYLLTGILGKLHLILKDVNSDITILQMQGDLMKHHHGGSSSPTTNSTCQPQDDSGHEGNNIWEAIASKRFAASDLVNCQVLSM